MGTRVEERLAPFFAVGDGGAIERVWDGPIERIAAPDEAASVFGDALPVLTVACSGDIATLVSANPKSCRGLRRREKPAQPSPRRQVRRCCRD